jgi:sugar phosphate isomerase/epimerase
MIKLGLVSAILPDMTFEDLIKYAAGVGFTYAEVCCWPRGKAARRYAGITHIDVDAADGKALARHKAIADENDVAISSLGYYPNQLDADSEARKSRQLIYGS